jgi:hypothetical protein
MFYILLVVDGDVPPTHKFCDEEAEKGLLLGHEAVAKAFGVPVENVHYLPREMMGNIDTWLVCIPPNKVSWLSTQKRFWA